MGHTTTYLGRLVLTALVLFKSSSAQCTDDCSGPESTPNITIDAVTSTNATISWSSSFGSSDSPYFVKYREQDSGSDFMKSEPLNTTYFTITDLDNSKMYEVKVCNETSYCGDCLLCFQTLASPIPDPPQNFMVSSVSPNAFIVNYEAPTGIPVETFLVHYSTDRTNLSITESTENSDNLVISSTESRVILPNTTYFVALSLISNGKTSERTEILAVTTRPLNNDPGVLLISYDDVIGQRPIIDENSITEDVNPFITISDSFSAIDIDYDYRNNHLYVTTNNNSIVRYSYNTSETDGAITLTSNGYEVLYSNLGDTRSITVDWINQRIYWFEFETNGNIISSQIYSGPFSGDSTDIRHHGQSIQGSLDSLTVDPIHGYFYWVIPNSMLVRINHSSIAKATQDTDLTSLYKSIASGSLISSFTLDLADLQYYYVETEAGTMIRVQLSGNEPMESGNVAGIPILKTSFRTRVVLILGVSLFVRTETYGSSSGTFDAPSNVLDARMLRSSYQPLPVPPGPVTNIRVYSNNTSADLVWNIPTFTSDIFGPDAFTNWEYSVCYRPIGSSDSFSVIKTINARTTILNLTPGTTYTFFITAKGIVGNEAIRTPTHFFSTFGSDYTPSILITTNEGVLLSDPHGTSVRFLSDERVDASSASTSNSYFEPTRYYISDDNGDFFTQDGSMDPVKSVLQDRMEPRFLQLDWISRKLYWVEDEQLSIVRISTIISNLSSPVEMFETSTESINGMALDSLNGVLFWITSTGIIGKSLNGLMDSWECYPRTNLKAITIDPINGRLFILYYIDSVVYMATLNYTTFSCDETSFVSRPLDALTLDPSVSLSIAYGANTLYLSQYNTLEVSSVSAEFALSESNHVPAFATIDVTPTTNQPNQLRALSVILRDNQPLPFPESMVFDISGNEQRLTPPSPGRPVLSVSTSNTTFIDVIWEPSDFEFSEVFYRVSFNLTPAIPEEDSSTVTANVLSGNSFSIADQSFSTRVMAFVTPYSVWYQGETISNFFLSPAALPAQVQNVRAYVYSPIRNNSNVVSAQIVWDGLTLREAGGVLSMYSISIYNEEDQLITDMNEFNNSNSNGTGFYDGPPFFVGNSSAQFGVVLSGVDQHIFYPLQKNRNYSVTVKGVNSAGSGEDSDEIFFSTSGNTPPREVFVATPTGGRAVGEFASNTSFSSITPPIAMNNLNRTLYYYDNTNRCIIRGSPDGNVETERLAQLHSDFVPLAFAFDWIAQSVYIVGRNSRSEQVEVWSVSDLIRNPINLRMAESIGIPEDTNISAIINPYRGLLHWTQSSAGESTRLYQLNLRDNSIASFLSSSNKRSVDLSSLQITSAMTWDPFTQEVWLCDASTGNIIACNASTTQLTNCEIVVESSALGVTPNGLPADQLAIDEGTIYWSRSSEPSVYYVTRNDPDILQSFAVSDPDQELISVSPGQQPLPDATISTLGGSPPFIQPDPVYCLSPDFRDASNRPVAMLVRKTSTSLELSWNEAELPSACDDIVFSLLPSTYKVHVENEDMDTFEITVTEPMVILNDLAPFTRYDIRITASNIYSVDKGGIQGSLRNYTTEEGVPDAIDTLRTLVYGPRHIFISWDPFNQTRLRGNTLRQFFILSRDGQMIANNLAVSFLNVTTNLQPNSSYVFGIVVNNGVHESPQSTIEATTFSLPPTAITRVLSSSSFSIAVALTEDHRNIVQIRVIVSNSSLQFENEMVFNVSSDLSSFNNTMFENTMFNNTMFNYTVGGLVSFTEYRVTVEGTYSSFTTDTGERLAPVTASSNTVIVQTDPAVPDTPVIRLEGSVIRWDEPNNNGRPINKYTLFYREQGTNTTLQQFDVDTSVDRPATSQDINRIALRDDTTYLFQLEAANEVGPSKLSNEKDYTTDDEAFGLIEALMYIVAPVGSILVLIFILLLIICCCCLCATPDKRATFRPDYELIRLREEYAKSRQHAFNPNYMWSRDDYTTYQDDLDNMNKFPRNKLRLENFIDRGEFGEVYQGTAIDILAADSGPTPVAVKTMRKGASQDEKEKFLSEAALMSHFNHQNIVKVLGVCLDNDPIFIIMELMPAGDLLKFLREARQESGPPLLTLAEQVTVSKDVAQGCRYLEQQHFIHRDIAARNCLVTSKGADRVVKIGDFGLAKDLYTSDYYQVEGQRKLPVRWMAPEALLQGKFTIETDIWSYGVLLWEIFTFGNQPYPGRNNQEVLQFVTGGGRLEKPDQCSIRVFKLMQACWETSPSERLHFAQIADYLSHYLEHVNNKRDSYYSDEDEDGEGGEDELSRKNSKPSRTSSVRSVGLINLARQGSVRIRRSIRVRASLKKEDFEGNSQNHTGLNSEENLVDDGAFRERGPF